MLAGIWRLHHVPYMRREMTAVGLIIDQLQRQCQCLSVCKDAEGHVCGCVMQSGDCVMQSQRHHDVCDSREVSDVPLALIKGLTFCSMSPYDIKDLQVRMKS